QDLDRLVPTWTVAHHHRSQSFALVIPGNQTAELFAADIVAEGVTAVSRVLDAGAGVAHADEEFRKRSHAALEWQQTTMNVDYFRRRRTRQHLANVLFNHVLGVQGHNSFTDL